MNGPSVAGCETKDSADLLAGAINDHFKGAGAIAVFWPYGCGGGSWYVVVAPGLSEDVCHHILCFVFGWTAFENLNHVRSEASLDYASETDCT